MGFFLVAVATLEMVLLVGWLVRVIVKKYSSFNDLMDFLETTPQQHTNNTQTMLQWPQFHNLKFTTWWNPQTIAQHGEIQKQLHNMMKYTNNCRTKWNSSQQHPNNTQTTLNLNYTSTIPYHNTTIAKHGEIQNQLHKMVKYTKNTQQGEIS